MGTPLGIAVSTLIANHMILGIRCFSMEPAEQSPSCTLKPKQWLAGHTCVFHSMGGVSMGNAKPMGATVYSMCSFQMPNVLLPYTLSNPLTPKVLHVF